MAKFLEGTGLNNAISDILSDAEETIILISPFIKLHHLYIDKLKSKKDNHNISIIVVFGKNEDDKSKSIKIDDIAFLKDFPNVEIRYESRLHAKYYANEKTGILSSMNLYDYSQNNNIEAGILLSNATRFGDIATSLSGEDIDVQAHNHFKNVIKNSILLYKRKPVFSDGIMGFNKKYIKSEIVTNELDAFFLKGNIKVSPIKVNTNTKDGITGYCLKCNADIPFGVGKPFCKECNSKSIHPENDKFQHCHSCGEKNSSSILKPVCYKCFKKGVLN